MASILFNGPSKQENINVTGFTTSPQWVRKFKRLHRIPQKITKFMTETIQSKEQKQKVRDLSRM